MSGDVQPRKRKDKKRRKDEGEQIPTQIHAPLSTNSANDDLNIHVHKEGGTGGGICAKLVFFVLLSAIAVLIGMIITEYRGQTDVDTVDTESRFSQIFEGWTDASPDHHDEHDIEDSLEDHDLDHDEENDVDNNSEAEDDEEEEHEPSQEEEEEEINDDNEISEEDDLENEEDLDEDEEQEDQELESEENQLDQDENDDIQDSEEDETYEESDEKEDDELEADENDHDDDEQELQNIDSDEADNDELADEDEVSSEKNSKEQEDIDDDQVDETDEDDEKVPVASKKIEIKGVEEDEIPPDEKQQESSGSMAVKLGVGVALLVVAHLVLVRKWRTAPDDKPAKEEPKEPTPDLSRRNTIVVPPTYQEVEQDIEQDEEDYSDEEVSEEESRTEPKAKTKYQELRSTYTRSLTPEGEIDFHKPSYEDEYEENIDGEEDEEVSEEDEEEDEEEGDSDTEEYDDDEDEELLKRLEAKYGKIKGDKTKDGVRQDVEDSDSDKESDDATGYEYSNITNKEDHKIKDEIDKAQKAVQNNSAYAIKLFDKILQNYPSSPRSIYGKALALDYLADQRRSNEILEQALKLYIQLFNIENAPHALFEMAAERCINRMRFVGQYKNAINVHKQLIRRFPNNPKHSNDLAVTYLTINRVEEARSVLKEILLRWPNNGFALVHLGFIFKTTDNKLEEAVEYLKKGLETKDEGVVDGRFYFHLGDALTRLGQNKEAVEVYEEGVINEVFLSKYQRSLYNVPRLTGKPWWKLEDLPYLDLYRLLKQNWRKIREEGLTVLNEKGYFQDESENLRDSGEWKQFELFARGQKNTINCKKCPFTCSLIEKIPEARGCKRGQTKFSVIHPGTHVWPHCGPTNCRLRTHLGLKVPAKTFIRVAEETRSWKEGEIFVFDDSFEHEVWHNGSDYRLVLIIDIWHPELTPIEKRSLSPI